MALLKRGREKAQALVIAVLAAGGFGSVLSAQPLGAQLELDVKAAFVYQFSRYVDWPAQSLPPGTKTPFRVCALASADFRDRLNKILEGESAAGHPMALVVVTGAQMARQCHVLYVEKSEAAAAESVLAHVRDAPVLTISDAPGFLAQGGHIALVRDDNRIRFDINLSAARRTGMTLHSQLLRVARNVIRGDGRLPES